MTVQDALRLGTRLLTDAGVDGAARDARKLIAALLEIDPARLTLVMPDAFDPLVEENFIAAIKERAARRPLSHLLGYREFYGRRFSISSDVLDPRGDTETLVASALEEPFERVLDLGTGSGCILLSLLAERPEATGVGTDLSEAALAVAARNVEAFDCGARCALLVSDWFAHVRGMFDLIVSNPPYIAMEEMAALAPELGYEPRAALTDEGDGLRAYRVIAASAGAHLTPGGRLMVEIGWQQGPAVRDMLKGAGFKHVQILRDLEGHDRVVKGVKPA